MTKIEDNKMTNMEVCDISHKSGISQRKNISSFEEWKKRRVVCDPRFLGGKPTFKDTRLSVHMVSIMLNNNLEDELREDYPYLEEDDFKFAKQFTE